LPKKQTATRRKLASLLSGGDLRSLGRANSIATAVLANTRQFSELLQCMWSDDPVVRMRAADAVEKVSAVKPKLLQPFKAELLGLAEESQQQEVQWHLALLLPRLRLTPRERQRAFAQLKEYLQHRSSIVKTLALQGLSELAHHREDLSHEVAELLAEASRSGTPAMKARARKLLSRWHK
jgi:hypothetical protein